MTTRFELQGHRGARGLFAENTIEGFIACLDFALDSIELDVAVTADDVAVVVHDPVLNPDLTRRPDGMWLADHGKAIRTLTLAELSQFDVGRVRPGSAAAVAHPEQRAFDGVRIPTLAAVFAATSAAGIRLDVELKTDPDRPDLTVSPAAMAEIVVHVAEAAAALGRLAIRSFDWRGLDYLRTHHPDIPLAWLTDATQGADTPARVEQAASGSRYRPTWAPAHATLDAGMIKDAHARGLRVVPWTVNSAADMQRLIDWGVDGICTDRPDIALSLRPNRHSNSA